MMVLNEKLKKVVLGAICDIIPPSADRIPIIEDKNEKLAFFEQNCRIHDERDYRIVIRFSGMIAYGYDFEKKETARYFYNNALERAKKLSGGENLETLIAEGITENCGWYITK